MVLINNTEIFIWRIVKLRSTCFRFTRVLVWRNRVVTTRLNRFSKILFIYNIQLIIWNSSGGSSSSTKDVICAILKASWSIWKWRSDISNMMWMLSLMRYVGSCCRRQTIRSLSLLLLCPLPLRLLLLRLLCLCLLLFHKFSLSPHISFKHLLKEFLIKQSVAVITRGQSVWLSFRTIWMLLKSLREYNSISLSSQSISSKRKTTERR